MKHLLIILILSFLMPSSIQAQNKKDEIQAKRVEFITRKLDLTPEEAQKFWPVQNEYDKKRLELRKEKKALRPSTSLDEMSDKEVSDLLDKKIALDQKGVDLDKTYLSKFKSVLPIKKVAKLQVAEEQFKKELIKQLKENRGPRQGPQNRRPGPNR